MCYSFFEQLAPTLILVNQLEGVGQCKDATANKFDSLEVYAFL